MSKPKPKRTKKYGGPKRRSVDTISEAICGAAVFMPQQITLIRQRPEAAYLLLCQGKAQNHDWNEIAQAMGVAEVLAQRNIGNNLMPQIVAALSALSSIAVRMQTTGRTVTCYPAELAAVREGLDVYGIQVKVCTQNEFYFAGQKVKRFLESIPEGTVEEYMALYKKERPKENSVLQ